MLPYIGGKFHITKEIIARMPEHITYVEVFGGAGWVLYVKPPSQIEVYNDINSDLVNLFLQIRDNFKKFKEKAYWVLSSQEIFNTSNYMVEKDKILRAIKFAIKITMCFSGIETTTYRYAVTSIKRNNWLCFYDRLHKIRERLTNVNIENLDFEDCIRRYDSENTFFYCDLPYFKETKKDIKYYTFEFSKEDHKRLAEKLNAVKGKVLVSYYYNPSIEILYPKSKWIYENIKKIKHSKILKKTDKKEKSYREELFIRNYELNNLLFSENEILKI